MSSSFTSRYVPVEYQTPITVSGSVPVTKQDQTKILVRYFRRFLQSFAVGLLRQTVYLMPLFEKSCRGCFFMCIVERHGFVFPKITRKICFKLGNLNQFITILWKWGIVLGCCKQGVMSIRI